MNCDRTYFSNICIDLTERCNIRCRHCILDVNEPGKPPGWAVIERLITEAADLQEIQEIAFVGGEPFLEYQTLVKSVALCRRKGLRSSVVTNGYWAKNATAANKMLGELDGLTTLSVSTD
ncbi:MAG: radical SAM protein, partial [Methanocorpusculum sp.]|nr:radical SAM protein [Methanocorpusculum sp.]